MTVGLSFIDRLSASDANSEASSTALREGLRRDLEALLNTRRRMLSLPGELDALEGSLLDYGLDDFTNESHGSQDFQDEFIENVERLLRRFEPRLGRFEVTVLADPDKLDRTLRFRIAGVVTLGGSPQELHFDSHVDPVRGNFVIRA